MIYIYIFEIKLSKRAYNNNNPSSRATENMLNIISFLFSNSSMCLSR